MIVWQKARELTNLLGKFSKDISLRDQIRRSAVPARSNIPEGFERRSMNEFYQFLVIAKTSCAEVRSQNYVALDAGYINETAFLKMNLQAKEVSQVFGDLRASIVKKKILIHSAQN